MDLTSGSAIGAAIPHKTSGTSLSYHEDGAHVFAATEADSRVNLINNQAGKCDQPAKRATKWASTAHSINTKFRASSNRGDDNDA